MKTGCFTSLRYVQHDQLRIGMGKVVGGASATLSDRAADYFPPLQNAGVIPNGTQWNEESA